jgi:hypothetical protein
MAKLPKRDLPSYTVSLPVSNLHIAYRPYTVKEQKLMMLAAQSTDEEAIKHALFELVDNCTDVESRTLCDADFEFLFLKLISASVSPVAQAEITHDCMKPGCPINHPCAINLDDVQVEGLGVLEGYEKRKEYYIIKFDETSGVCMKPVSSKDTPEQTIFASVVSVYDADGVYDEFSEDDLMNYVDGLTGAEFAQIQKFLDAQPYCSTRANAKCQKCSKTISSDLKGVIDFLA